jgi:hypothetical protein
VLPHDVVHLRVVEASPFDEGERPAAMALLLRRLEEEFTGPPV